MGAFDGGTYRSPKDILDRQSRPQQHSTWVGARRDWRYRTGVFRHTDHEDSPRDRTIWDKLDYDVYEDPHRMQDLDLEVSGDAQIESESKGDSNTDTPERIARYNLEVSGDAQIESESEGDSNTDTPERIARYSPTLAYAGLQASSQSQREMINPMLPSQPSSSEDPVPPTEPMLFETPTESTNILQGPAGSLRKMWHDSTCDFNMLTVRTTLRLPNETSGGLVRNYSWYADATPVDALLPPGVPLSIKEILVYYPHHVRWQEVMLRLTHNDYRGQDILGAQVRDPKCLAERSRELIIATGILSRSTSGSHVPFSHEPNSTRHCHAYSTRFQDDRLQRQRRCKPLHRPAQTGRIPREEVQWLHSSYL